MENDYLEYREINRGNNINCPCAGIASRSREEGSGWRMCQMADFDGGDIEPPNPSNTGREVTLKLLVTIFHTE